MNIKLFIVLFTSSIYQYSFSQTEKLVYGKILCDDFPIKNAEIINFNTKKVTSSNASGDFTIIGNINDLIIVFSKNYEEKKIILKRDCINNNNLVIQLIKKPEQLEEVIITKKPVIKFNYNYKQISEKQYLDDAQTSPKNPYVYDGIVQPSVDFVKIINYFFEIAKKDKIENKHNVPKIEFKELAKKMCSEDFFIKKLELKEEDIYLFLDFCDADSNSKLILERNNVLDLMDFLFAKNNEFKKLAQQDKY